MRDLDDVARKVGAREGPLAVTGLRGAARAATLAHLARIQQDRPTLVVVPTAKAVDRLVDDLRTTLGEADADGRVRAFPRLDTQPYERFSPQPFVVAARMDVLYRWLASPAPRPDEPGTVTPEPAPIVVTPWTALALRVPSRDALRARTVHLEVGQTIDRDALVTILTSSGYQRMPLVEERGELAVRGGILDLFPPQRPRPVRVELFGDEVDSIREFDAASQRSQQALPRVVAPPPRELLLERSLVVDHTERIRDLAESQGVAPRQVDELLDALLRGQTPPGAEALAPLLQAGLETVLDYLPPDTLVVLDDEAAGRERLDRYLAEALENFEVAAASGRVVSPPADLLLTADELWSGLRSRNPVSLQRLDVADGPEDTDPDGASGGGRLNVRASDHSELVRALARTRAGDAALAPLIEAIDQWRSGSWRIVLTSSSLSGAERLRTLLSDYGVVSRSVTEPRPVWRWSGPGRVEVRATPLSEGFALPLDRLVVVTEEEIFGPRQKRRKRAQWPAGAAVEAIAQLGPGDFVVHADHGIGIYRGLVELDLRGAAGEFLRIEYADGDRLFLPVDRLNRIQIYSGADGGVPRVDKLGGVTWEKAKRGVRKSVRDMARELLAVHAARELAPGFAFSPRDRAFEEFEASFPFEETPDQLAAIEDVLSDMQKARPMDRLVCGDVGYGKTEVAVRAAFRAAMDGRQVAVLVPTTVLCQQHEETFRERLSGYPIEIASLSRFHKPKDAKRVLADLASGKVDVVIGTHRLLQKNVIFRDLGLLIVDEEHRFGVAHKERIKQLKKTLDVITLTATPIPRTLQLAFAGIRDLSVIETPPVDRLAIRTQVCRSSEGLVSEVILREVRRGGQVFFVHNRVRTIGAIAEMLSREIPDVKVIVAHGQMKERELEEKMLAFMHGEADVLLCTTIIESGIDIPRANTIVIDRADRLGLAQLYQLRGRVGRSNQRAYAYLLIPGQDLLTPDAERRLEAIQDLSELGSGFRLANLDLEIRGAGNLLGAEQSGNLAEVGYDTYMEMLEATIDEMRGVAKAPDVDPEIRLPVTARLPDDYVPSVNQRLVLYKRLASCPDDDEVDRIRDEILDRYGPLPEPAANLIEVIRIKIHARRLGVAAVDVARGDLVLTASESTQIDPKRLMNLLTHAKSGIRVTPGHKIFAPLRGREPGQLFDATRRLLGRLEGAAG